MHKPLNLHGYPGEFQVALTMNDARTTKENHIKRLACSIGGLSSFPSFPKKIFCCHFADPFTH